MENYKNQMFKLQEYKEQTFPFGLQTTVHHSQLRRYKLDYVNTVKFNPKSGTFEPFDSRTKTFYNEKDANKFILTEVDKNRKQRFLEEVGTTTPAEDLSYLYAYNKLQHLKSDKELNPVWKIRNSFSPKVEGTDTTLYEQKWLQDIKDAEAKLLKLRAGTSYERTLLEDIKAKRDGK